MPRRSTRRSRPTSPVPSNDDDEAAAAAAAAEPTRRVSSRATKFASSMKEPKNSIDDILPPPTPEAKGKKKGRGKNRGGGRTSKKRRTSEGDEDEDDSGDEEEEMAESSEEEEEEEDDDEEEVIRPSSTRTRGATRSSSGRGGRGGAPPPSPKVPKSPAIRHKTRRRTVRTEIPIESDIDEESSEEEVLESDEEEGSEEEEEEEGEELKIQRIIASRSETRKKWREICSKMNTSEIDSGSRWFQDNAAGAAAAAADGDDGDNDDNADVTDADNDNSNMSSSSNNDSDDKIFEERFLVKWSDLSFLHCSWESQDDLVAQVDNAKSYLTTFFRKSENGLLFDADERGDGEFFDPSYVQIERILEIIDPEEDEEEEGEEEEDQSPSRSRGRKHAASKSSSSKAKGKDDKMEEEDEDEDTSPIEKYGIILDKDDPNYEDGTGRQFLIKWGNSPYSDSTYEFERDLILNEVEYEEHVDSFLRRSKKPTKAEMTKLFSQQEEQRRRLYKIFGEKAKGKQEDRDEKIEEYQKQLENHVFVNGGQVRDYQAEGIAWMVSNFINKRSSILADEMGLGKTIQTAVFVNTLATEIGLRGPFLIVAPLSTIPHWYREFSGWTNLNTIVYHGSARDREYIRELEMAFESDRPHNLGFNSQFLRRCHKRKAAKWEKTWMTDVIITTPEMLVTDDYSELTAIKWDVLVVDEAHRLKNHSSKLASNLRDERFQFGSTLLLTGTPIQNNMQEMWTLLNIVDPDSFDDVDSFLERYGDIKSKDRVDELHETIRPYILRRLKEDVEKSVPPKEETLIEVELTVLQKQYYRALYEKNVQFLHRNQKKALDGPSINNLAVQLRKCCNHPFLLRGVEHEVRAAEHVPDDKKAEADFLVRASGKLVLLDKLLPKLKEDGHRVLVFSQFKIMLDIIEDYLTLREMKHERIDGSITGKKRQMAIDRFQAEESEDKETSFVMLLSTRAGGVGINLTAADTCIIFDSDWNPQNDLQAQARCHRIGQTKSVKVYRLLTRKTYEMQMFHQSSLKMGLDQAVLQGIEGGGADGEGVLSKEEVEKLLRHGAYDIFNEEKSGSSEQESKEFESQDIDSILARRAKTVVHENTGSKSSAAGGTFSKASFKAKKTEGQGTEGEGGDDADDVDIDDPDFWKKMVGEAQVDDEDNLHGKKRKRKEANYSEKDYDKNLRKTLLVGEADESVSGDDDTSVSSVDSDSDASDSEDNDNEFGQGELLNEALALLRDETKALSQKRERYRWGGKGKDDWSKADCELLLAKLQTCGYGNMPWDGLFSKIDFTKPGGYSDGEMRRMCWALALITLREVVDEDVREVARRAVRAAEKKRESEEGGAVHASSDDGGILGSATERTAADKAEEQKQLDQSFKKQWQANAAWVSKALEDAVAYVKTHSPRKEVAAQDLFDAKSHGERLAKKPLPPLTLAFNENIWPALKSRGWKDEPSTEKARHFVSPPKRYIYQGRTYKNVGAVLDAAPKAHPELANTVETVIASVRSETAAKRTVDDKESSTIVDKVSGLDGSNVTADSLSLLLRHYGPSQLLIDRTKENTRVKTGRRFLLLLSYLNAAHALVARARSGPKPPQDGAAEAEAEFSDREVVNNLAKLISVDKRSALPHPNWKPVHDAVLINAIAKHGWIDRDAARRAITEDKSIKWGRPFDDGDVVVVKDEPVVKTEPAADDSMEVDEENDNELVSELMVVANRVAAFFNTEGSMLGDLKGFNQDLVVKNYGLVKEDEDEDADGEFQTPPTWRVDETLLIPSNDSPNADGDKKEEIPDEVSELPTRKELLKRAKTILSRAMANTSEAAASSTTTSTLLQQADKGGAKAPEPDHDFCLLDQSNRRNVFFAEILRGITKTSLNKASGQKIAKTLLALAVKEIDSLVEACTARVAPVKAEGSDPAQVDTPELQDMKKIKGHMDLVKRTLMKHHRQGKNVLRVILGVDPIASKNATDGLFPVVPKYGTLSTTTSKKKENKPAKKEVKSEKTEKAIKTKKTKKKDLEHKESAMGDIAINRALALGIEMDKSNDTEAVGAASNFLKLTAIETLILSVICSQGLPAFGSNWEPLVYPDRAIQDNQMPGQDFVINWYRMGGVVLNAASVWADIARSNYEKKQMQLERNGANLSDDQVNDLRAECRWLELDLKRKQDASKEATELRNDAYGLARKSIMMLLSLKEKMGPLNTKTKKPQTESGLGPKVLRWCCNELDGWASVLDITDESRTPIAAVTTDFPEVFPELSVAAIFDKKACRTVFVQVAQQSRLRSLFIKNGTARISDERLPHAVMLSESSGDEWDYRPSWWVCNAEKVGSPMPCPDDMDLLSGILDYGYSGFDEMIRLTETFRLRCQDEEQKEKDATSSLFTRATIQQRVNHLTRELHELEESTDVHRLLDERKTTAPATAKKEATVQPGINSFFIAKGKDSSQKPTSSKNNDDVSVVEIDDDDDDADSSGGVKRSAEEGSEGGSAEKKMKPSGSGVLI